MLASASPRRQELIAKLGLPVIIRPSDADENTPPDWSPATIVEELSLRKARAVAEATDRSELAGGAPLAIVVGSDTIVALAGEAMGKPKDESDAEAMLSRLQGRSHEVYTGVTLLDPGTGRAVTRHQVTKVRMKTLSPEQIRRYVATGEPMDKAGAYGIQGGGALLVESIEGDFYGVMGLPVSLVAGMLESFDIVLP
ncbi:Maf family protein [Cohnella fermenti]|uniref:Maf family protein n=1 Tax=Cohnella fermenti TaxID=2565925 RepID=UPI001E5BB0AB|nr:Maf family protein [Cohnella fermenti]